MNTIEKTTKCKKKKLKAAIKRCKNFLHFTIRITVQMSFTKLVGWLSYFTEIYTELFDLVHGVLLTADSNLNTRERNL